jgi:hypothetical protein
MKSLGVQILIGDEANQFDTPEHAEAERMRREDEQAFQRLKQYIEEHRGELLGLELALSLYRRPQ